MDSKAAPHCSLSHLGFPGSLITSQIFSPTRMTSLLKQVSPGILLASLYYSWTHPGSCQLPQELSQEPSLWQAASWLFQWWQQQVRILLSLFLMKLHSPWAIKACYPLNSIHIPHLVPFMGHQKQCLNLEATPWGIELSPFLTFIGWSCILVILEGSTTGLGRLNVSRIFCHWGGRPTNLPSFGSNEVWTRCSKFCGAEISGRFFFFFRNMMPEGEKATLSVPV